ncbi:pseudouridine synthase [Paludibacterium paludis]|uniref:Ribosomal large subunit pseudouridine synthase E n=1 Tax=Paludibacterium paludis TaxID=1225769 RepID=A0A918P6E4_9NEIS|nr:pseudouridine synthase [Paludibacterium paludis]GGY25921.1 ribosomal large subunit pseudouridine synthase E [Paludibacterium paludis]
MPDLILLNKPYGVICQFSEHETHPTLKTCVDVPGVYPAGRLDTDSEGLVLLTPDGAVQHGISDPRWKLPKTYWVQVEGIPDDSQLDALRHGVDLGDFVTREARVERLAPPDLWPRHPPVRFRKSVPDSWLALTIHEGKNRQVRRMTARVGLPTLRLVRVAIGPWRLDGLEPGQWRRVEVGLEELPALKHANGKPGGRVHRGAARTRGRGR